jgi:hypothetical protein
MAGRLAPRVHRLTSGLSREPDAPVTLDRMNRLCPSSDFVLSAARFPLYLVFALTFAACAPTASAPSQPPAALVAEAPTPSPAPTPTLTPATPTPTSTPIPTPSPSPTPTPTYLTGSALVKCVIAHGASSKQCRESCKKYPQPCADFDDLPTFTFAPTPKKKWVAVRTALTDGLVGSYISAYCPKGYRLGSGGTYGKTAYVVDSFAIASKGWRARFRIPFSYVDPGPLGVYAKCWK